MKRCPVCNRIEIDDSLAFCRTDGSPLVTASASPEAATIAYEVAVIHCGLKDKDRALDWLEQGPHSVAAKTQESVKKFAETTGFMPVEYQVSPTISCFKFVVQFRWPARGNPT